MNFDFKDTMPIDPPDAEWMPLEHRRPNTSDDGLWLLMGIVGALLCVLCLIALLVVAR